jgi:hypothetical protein
MAGCLKTVTDHLSPLVVRRIIQVANEDIMGSLIAICQLDREVHELSVIHPDGYPIKQMESVVQMFEDEILEWKRRRTVHPDSAAETCSDLAQEPTGQELVDVLEKILAEAHAAKWPKPGPINTGCTWQVLQQATKVSRMAREI